MGEFDTAKGCISRSLAIEYFDASMSNATIKDLVKKTECLYIWNWNIKGGCKNIIPDMFQILGGGLTELIELALDGSEEMESLIDTSDLQYQEGNLFSKLSNLWIGEMKHLVDLCRGSPYPSSYLDV